MADSVARSHLAHSSIRAQATRRKQTTKEPKKNKAEPGDKQSVKAVLGAPWTVQWEGQGEDMVGLLCAEIGEVDEYHRQRERRKRATSKSDAPPIPSPTPPPVLSSITFGLNETIKQLERARLDLEISVDALIAGHADFRFSDIDRDGLIPTAPVAGPSRLGTPPAPPPRIIFVCVHDINPRELVEHVPRYVGSWNALLSRSRARLEEWARADGVEGEDRKGKVERLVGEKEMWLVPLKKGSEQVLAHAVGLRRVSVMSVTNDFPNLSDILSHLAASKLQPPMPPFPLHALAPSSITTPIYAPTLLKAVHTTTPTDVKGRKARRVAAIRVAREAQKRKKREEVERTRKTIGWKIGDKWYGGSEQKKRNRKEKWEGRKRVEGMIKERKKKKAVKEKTAKKRGELTVHM